MRPLVGVILGAILGATLATAALATETLLVQLGSPTLYLANATDPGIGLAWTAEGFDDASWTVGAFGVGYEQSPPGASALIQLPVAAGSYSVYTRSRFTVPAVGQVLSLTLGADYDDGYVAWINGTEVYRSSQMPAGTPAWNTNAGLHESSNGATPSYGSLLDITAAALPVLHDGINVLAIGVWNGGAPISTDLVLVPRLAMDDSLTVTRGPYLQLATPTQITIRWRTNVPTDSCVRHGASIGGLTTLACDAAPTTEHVVTLTGLEPDTRRYYSVGTSVGPLAGGDAGFFFDTSPAPGSAVPTRVWVLGDSGTADANAAAVRDAYAGFNTGARTNLMLMLGDNAYSSGTDAQYQAAVFDMYPSFLRNTVLWPTLGNHDGISADSATGTGPYYANFTLPRNGEAGGLASGTEAYYSFDYGDIHFICLESFETDRSPGAAMMTWLAQDAMATTRRWIVAFWHHPPYSKGSHDSDAESALIDMRRYALPILEQAGVDLVLTGHSHSYERSFLIDGHYGLSTTFGPSVVKDAGDGRVAGTGAYKKPSLQPAPHEGAVYVVAGSSGQTSGGSLDHPAMFLSLNDLGSVVLDVDGRRLDARFVDASGAVGDLFTIYKGPRPTAAFEASATTGEVPLGVDFSDLSTNDPSAWAWDLDGDGATDSVQRNPSHTYGAPGLYTVSLTASNLAGSDAAQKPGFVCAVPAGGAADTDGDGIVDLCDPDDDNDGTPDATDCAPLDAAISSVPAEVGATLTIGPSAEALSWQGMPQATFYDVYRGQVDGNAAFAYTHVCHEPRSQDTASADGTLPVADSFFYYLVTAGNACAEGPPGNSSSGAPRPNPSPCP